MRLKLERVRELLLQNLPNKGLYMTPIENVAIFRTDEPHIRRPELSDPHIIILGQGSKKVYQKDETYLYDSSHYFVQTLPVPVECEAILDNNEPILGLFFKIDPTLIGEILNNMDNPPISKSEVGKSLYVSDLSEPILDGVIRFLETFSSKDDASILGPIYLKEILYKMIKGENGDILRHLSGNNKDLYHISKVINNLHRNYSKPINVKDLARDAGMSVTSFYTSFKAMTNTSPLQYIKDIRLHKAKELIQQNGLRANSAASLVGYESSSQFSREYKRCFGVSPSKDAVA